jgi:hypothetical protein
MKEESKPPHYVISLNNDMIENCLKEGSSKEKNAAIDFLKQVSRSRIFEKLDEKYNSEKYFLFILSDSVKKTEMEQLIVNEGCSFREKNMHASLRVVPNSSRNYSKVESPLSKKNWLRQVKNLQESMYIPNASSYVHYDVNVHSFTNGSSSSSPSSTSFIGSSSHKVEKKKIIKKRKTDDKLEEPIAKKETKSKESRSSKSKEVKIDENVVDSKS